MTRRLPRDWPEPAPEAWAVHERLVEAIRAEIARAGGFIGFARYMDLALYAPGLGYYTAGSRKLGRGGDFVTAPELGPVFARCLARALAPTLRATGGVAVELGAGSGALAADLLPALAALDALPREYRILETSADLRERQREVLAARAGEFAARVRWLDRAPDAPFAGVVFGNEVIDALPVERFLLRDGGVQQLGVRAEREGFAWAERPAPEDLAAAVGALGIEATEGYRSEVCTLLPGWMRAVTEKLERGAALFVDYGYPRQEYYLPERRDGTLLCHYRHRAHGDPFLLAGLQDITASVDFTAVAEAGVAAGLDFAGYTTQAHWLIGLGVAELAAAPDANDARTTFDTLQQIKRLTMPGEMGERFQVIAFTRGADVDLPGFDTDFRHRL